MNIKMCIMKHQNIFTALLFLLLPALSLAQQEAMYGQYIFNSSVINPAQAGGNNASQWGALGRYQWLGFDGAPETQSMYANFNLPRQMGLAIGLYHDKIGPEVNLQMQADLAYHARLSEKWTLAGGLRLIGSHLKVNLRDVPNVDPNNPYFQDNLSSGVLFNLGAGLLAYSDKSFFGISLPRALKNAVEVSDAEFTRKHSTHLFAYAGTNIDLSDEFMFLPSTMFRYVEDAPVQLDLNTMFSFRNTLDFGPMLRSNMDSNSDWFDALGFIIGIQFLEKWHFGYMYEYPLSDIRDGTVQTHEVSLRFSWDTPRISMIRSPRYFL